MYQRISTSHYRRVEISPKRMSTQLSSAPATGTRSLYRQVCHCESIAVLAAKNKEISSTEQTSPTTTIHTFSHQLEEEAKRNETRDPVRFRSVFVCDVL